MNKDGDAAAKALMDAVELIDVHRPSIESKYLLAACIACCEYELDAARTTAKNALAYAKQRSRPAH
ncbi:hypothetical protein BJG93_34060 (plasmid) [Paraburkholderia sprentiae WSM5005]|uniref:Uncharacterized protein n=1 Tax=Paraburkholderia sprentiae WSM5005 TaxID=754502 RepID=A0A1I9YWM4_9BURK|nr:hypothetical protein [Paraburkholderia sprentiae]APA90575.1 hypothetical protein BJG93_34060 [Paraburkholderia sprentiae WSM5005]